MKTAVTLQWFGNRKGIWHAKVFCTDRRERFAGRTRIDVHGITWRNCGKADFLNKTESNVVVFNSSSSSCRRRRRSILSV